MNHFFTGVKKLSLLNNLSSATKGFKGCRIIANTFRSVSHQLKGVDGSVSKAAGGQRSYAGWEGR